MAITFALFATLLSVRAEREPFPFFEPVTPPRPVQVMVHRGLGMAAPENTRRAIEMCVEDYYEWVEIDVRLTKDGKHVVFHDDRLDSKSDHKGLVADLTLNEILSVDAGSWFAPRFRGAKILTLPEALRFGKGKINFYLDCKRINPELLATEVLEAGMEKQVIVYDNPSVISKVRSASARTIPVMTKWLPAMGDPVVFAAKNDLSAVEINADDISSDVVGQFKKAGVKVQAKVLGENWDNSVFWRKCISSGVDWLQTDKPLQVLTLAERDRHPVWPVKLAYHRGANRYAPENTIPAIRLASELEADYIEIDVRTTKDGKCYLMHDRTTDRTTGRKALFKDLSSSEVKSLEAGSWFGKPYADTRVPSFQEALTTMGEKSAAYLDCKDINPEVLSQFLRLNNLHSRSVICAPLQVLEKLKTIDPQARALPSFRGLEDLERVAGLKPYAVDAKWECLSEEVVSKCHGRGILVFSDALGRNENVEQYLKAINWGVDLIQTDHPAKVLRAVEIHFSSKHR
jgi:glycerophosphoryl diester phosphodiesterase